MGAVHLGDPPPPKMHLEEYSDSPPPPLSIRFVCVSGRQQQQQHCALMLMPAPLSSRRDCKHRNWPDKSSRRSGLWC